MTVTLGCVFRAVLTVARTGFIWLFDVALFYSPLGRHRLGEPFEPVASTVQMIGFCLGIFGTLIYAYGSSRCAQAVALVSHACQFLSRIPMPVMLSQSTQSGRIPVKLCTFRLWNCWAMVAAVVL